MREEIHVALCDDEQTVFLMAEELIRRYEIAYQVTLLTDYYTDAESLLGNVDSYDLLLLDIEMPDMDGIELGRKLLEKDYSGKIIFYNKKGYQQGLGDVGRKEECVLLHNIMREDCSCKGI